jgi:hypothetical protein
MRRILFYILIIFLVISIPRYNLFAEELSRDEAKHLLQGFLQKENPFNLTKNFQKYGLLYGLSPDNGDINKYKELEQKGYLILKKQEDPLLSQGLQKNPLPAYGIQFTNKATPYLIEAPAALGNKAYVELAKIENLDVIDLKKISANEYKADVLIGYKLTPFGEIFLGRGIMIQRKEDALFLAHDEGWRIKFKVNF